MSAYLDPTGCPAARPRLVDMAPRTVALHTAIDGTIRRVGRPVLNPTGPTMIEDLFGSEQIVAWQEGKAENHLLQARCWSTLPPIYGRYGTAETRRLIGTVCALEQAEAAVVCGSGMTAIAALFDVVITPGCHAILGREVYNKTRTYLTRILTRTGGSLTVVDDGDPAAVAAAIRPETALIFAETFTNPRLRAQDPAVLAAVAEQGRETAPELLLVLDTTIATPWAFRQPVLSSGVDVVVASGTKALSGQDRDLWGYIASDNIPVMNRVMDLLALRGGIVDARTAASVVERLPGAQVDHARRCEGALKVAAFLAAHPLVAEVFHPSLPDHPDADAVAAGYHQHGSLLSFRIAGADEDTARHAADALATCLIIRYALSFDGLATKVNHHRSVSEYFTPPPLLRKRGIDRLIRLGVGLEEPDDLIAALNWTLWHGRHLSEAELAAWRASRQAELGLG